MGACGCGDFQGDFKFKGPGDDWYVLQVYPPCDYCETPAGIILYRMNKEDHELWRVEDIREVEIRDIGSAFAVVDADTLKHGLGVEDDDVDFYTAIKMACQAAIDNNNKAHTRIANK